MPIAYHDNISGIILYFVRERWFSQDGKSEQRNVKKSEVLTSLSIVTSNNDVTEGIWKLEKE